MLDTNGDNVYDTEYVTSYTVTFDPNGGTSVSSQTVSYGSTATEPTAPTKTGYTFDGWYLDGAKYDFDTAVTSDVTLTASWIADTTATDDTTAADDTTTA
ncbi:MAG: InlB B-repeat-containing protein, partial [Clostridia bacterium]|nr:InlB B-repeat-containing protein [Clostridia bacterium]